jgi:hypothetical protein
VYAVIRSYTFSDTGEVRRLVEEEFIPLVGDIPGLVSYYIVEGTEGRLSSVTICEDRSGIEESTQRAADWIRERLDSLIISGPEVMMGEVTFEHAAQRGQV